jgi:hypothetical protein
VTATGKKPLKNPSHFNIRNVFWSEEGINFFRICTSSNMCEENGGKMFEYMAPVFNIAYIKKK